MFINLSFLRTLIQSFALISRPFPQHLHSLQMKIIQNLFHRIPSLIYRLPRLLKRCQRPWLKILATASNRPFQKLIPNNLLKFRRLLVMNRLDCLVHLHYVLFLVQVIFCLLYVLLWACFLLVVYVYCEFRLVSLRLEGILNLLGKFIWWLYCRQICLEAFW